MIETSDVVKSVIEEVDKIAKENVSVESLVSDIKRIVINAMTKRGITVDDSITVSAKLIVLASIVK